MSDPDFEARLEVLNRRLAISARISDREPEPRQQRQPIYGWQTQYGLERTNRAVAGSSSRDAARADAAQTSAKPGLDYSTFIANACVSQDVSFSSWKWVQAYPDCFIGKTNKPRAKPFFDKILEHGVWDFFYLYNPEKRDNEPQLFVPSVQFEAFLEGINKTLGTALTVPSTKLDRYHITFGEGGTPRPRYLKRTRRQRTLEVEVWPQRNGQDVQAFQRATAAGKASMRDKLRLSMAAAVSAETNKKDLQKQKQLKKKEDRRLMLKQTQQFLHLENPSLSNVVFICVDVEAREVAPKSVTEVGVSILDTKDIRRRRPGHGGQNWWSFIKSYHFRVYEHASYRNHLWVQGCPDQFNFGTSTFPLASDVARRLEELLEPYTDQHRQLVLVGHDVEQDIEYLRQIRFDVSSMKNLVGQCDSQVVHQAWKDLSSGRSLEGVLGDLGISYRNLHNAGNDAAFTMRALIGVAVEELRQRQLEARGIRFVPGLLRDDPETFQGPMEHVGLAYEV